MENNVIIPFDSGNATIIPKDEGEFTIVITMKGIKYEFNSSPVGIESFSVDGGIIKNFGE